MQVFFDLDGPILDVSEKYYAVYKDLVKEMDGEVLPQDEYWRLKRKRVDKAKILEKSLIFERTEEYSKKRVERIETSDYLKIDSIWPGIRETLAMISECFPLYLVTARSNRISLMWQLEHLNIHEAFTSIISPSEKEMVLPRKELKRAMVRRKLGKMELSGWFIGDTDTDTSAGILLGLKTGVVAYGIRSENIVKSYGANKVFYEPSDFVDWAMENLTS